MLPVRFIKCAILAMIAVLAACQPDADVRFERAQQYYAKGDLRSAAIELRNTVQQQPDHVAARFLLAEAAYGLADYPTAENEYTRVLELSGDRSDAWLGLGRTLLAQGRADSALARVMPQLTGPQRTADEAELAGDIYLMLSNLDDAEVSYLNALELESASWRGLVGMAAVSEARGDSDAAREFIDSATRGHPDEAQVWLSAGNYFATRQKFDQAINAFNRAVELESGRGPTGNLHAGMINLVVVLLDEQRFAAAGKALGRLEGTFSGRPVNDYLRGRLAFGNGDYEQAQAALQRFLAQVPDDRRGQAMLGTVHFSRDHLLQAEMYLLQAVRARVGGDATRKLLAETQLRLNKPDLALSLLQETAADSSDDPLLLLMLGRAEAGVGDFAEASGYYEQVLAAEGRDPAIDLSVAVGLLAIGQTERAAGVLNALHAGSAAGFRREVLLIAIHLQEHRADKALELAAELVQDNPDDAFAHAIAGTLYLTLDKEPSAAQAFGRALEIDADNVPALFGMSRYAVRVNDQVGALSYLNKILDNEPQFLPALVSLIELQRSGVEVGDLEARLNAAVASDREQVMPQILLARYQLSRGDFIHALATIERAETEFPENPLLRHVKGIALFEAGQFELALNELGAAAAGMPANAVLQKDLAIARFQRRDFAAALDAVRRYRELRPGDFAGVVLAVNCHLQIGSTTVAREILERHASEFGDSPRVHLLRGDIAMTEGQYQDAVGFFDTASQSIDSRGLVLRLAAARYASGDGDAGDDLREWLRRHPGDSEILLIYGQIRQAQGQSSEAVGAYEQLLQQNRDNAVALNNLAWQYAQENREKAVVFAEKAYNIEPENGSIADTLGWIHFLNGDFERALPYLEQAAALAPANAEIQFHFASVLVKTGSSDKAKAILERILASADSFPSRATAEGLSATL